MGYWKFFVTIRKPHNFCQETRWFDTLLSQYRWINLIILPMNDSLPSLGQILVRFSRKTVFSSYDFIAGYWPVSLHLEVRKYTGRTYQFCVVPFILKISNTTFLETLKLTLNNPISDCNNQLDDIHIYVKDCSFPPFVFKNIYTVYAPPLF